MLLSFHDGANAFATGSAGYRVSGGRAPAHLTIEVDVAGRPTEAIIDTGAPYLICSPELAGQLSFDARDALDSLDILIRGSWIKGRLHRVQLILLASEGNSMAIEATAFVPDTERNFGAAHPSFLGYVGCLERIRFAIDPHTESFYFGPLP